MPQRLSPSGVLRFGPFEFEPKSGQLRSEGSTHLLADQPLALLNALLERPGEMVSREDLRHRLWPDGTFVDFEHGLNSAVSRLREALNDSATTPRFVETIPRRGYRLLVPVGADGPVLVDEVPPQSLPAEEAPPHTARLMLRESAIARRPRGRTVAWTGVAATLFVVCVAGVLQFRRAAVPAPLLASVVIDLPDEWQILNEPPAISPDSRHIIFAAWQGRAGRRAIWDRPLDTGAARILTGSEGGSAPFWSPDGKSIGFFAGGKLKVLQLAGNAVRVVCDAPADASGAWVGNDAILFAPGPTGAVSEVSVEHGAVRHVTELDRSTGELRHIRPTSLPDGRHFVYLSNHKDQLVATLASVDGTRAVALGPVQSYVVATPSGHVVFVRDGRLVAQRLDVAAERLTGDATVLAEGLALPGMPGMSFMGRFAISPAMLVYLKAEELPALSELKIFDRAGTVVGTVDEPAGYTGPTFSPDGTRMAVARRESTVPARDIWVFDLARGSRLHLTLDPSDDKGPRWSADGRWLMFSSNRLGVDDIYKRLASGDGADELVFASETHKSVNAWSLDGRFVVYDTGGPGSTVDLYVLPLSGDRRPVVLDAARGFQQQADISPDSRLIAYASSESGQYEVIVNGFPENTSRRQISTDGGREPVWRGDGKELFFLAGDTVMAVDVHTSAAGLTWSVPRKLFMIPNLQRIPRGFTVSPDGRRFVAVVATTPVQRFTTLLNWTALVK
jgi:eukaryotic-like serine/threonine-protein kinase